MAGKYDTCRIFCGGGDVINGTTWFLIPLGMFYIVAMLYGTAYKKVEWKSIYIVEGVLAVIFFIFHVLDVQIAGRLAFVYMPVSGLIMAELMKVKDSGKKKFIRLIIMFIVNYIQMILCFHRFYLQYYIEDRYLVSYMYALILAAFFLLFDKLFEDKKWCSLLCKISLAVYLLQMTWGSFLMQVLSDSGVLFSAAFLLTIVFVMLLGWFHSNYIENKLLKGFIHRIGL